MNEKDTNLSEELIEPVGIDIINQAGFATEYEGAPETYVGLDEPEAVAIFVTNSGLPIHKKITKVNRTKMSNKQNCDSLCGSSFNCC